MTKQAIRDGFEQPAARRAARAARGGGALALGGRLARRHERDARGDDPRPRLGRRRRLARPRPDADARDDRQARARDPGVRAGAVLARPRDASTRATRASGSRATRRGSRTASAPTRSSTKVTGKEGPVESVERKEQSERAPLLYDLTSLQRDANRRFGFSARRTLQAAQSLYEGKKAITYPRTNSRYLSGDLVPQLKPTAETLRADRRVRAGRALRARPRPAAARPRRQRREGRRPPRDHPDGHRARRALVHARRAAHLRPVARRFLAVFHPPARYARTTIVTEVEGERFRTRGKVTLEAGWRGVYGARGRRRRAQAGRGRPRARRAARARAGPGGPLRRGRERGEGDEAAAPLHRGDAPLRDGDRRQARSTTRSCARR